MHPQIDIIYQDEYLIIIRKSAGIPTVASGEEKDKTALRLLSEHLKTFNPQAKVYHVTRLDKDSAGFVVFTKSRELQTRLSEEWQKYCRRQQFAVVTERQPNPSEGVLVPASDSKAQEDQDAPVRQRIHLELDVPPTALLLQERLVASSRWILSRGAITAFVVSLPLSVVPLLGTGVMAHRRRSWGT